MIIVTYGENVSFFDEKEYNEKVIRSDDPNVIFCHHLLRAMFAFANRLCDELKQDEALAAFPLNVRFDVETKRELADEQLKLTANVTSLRNREQLDLKSMAERVKVQQQYDFTGMTDVELVVLQSKMRRSPFFTDDNDFLNAILEELVARQIAQRDQGVMPDNPEEEK